jgi:hypothetical protein
VLIAPIPFFPRAVRVGGALLRYSGFTVLPALWRVPGL